ncbi:MAG TPA: adenylyltransferase/cytidyltransferase family protein [Methylomirabilota bacterium]|jgi:nicotinamide-nucleotide adenylyltransferase|nr:adenylyltransferase/cytidyltransferase family protein [Methylomirabilota bacterium]
MTQLLSTPHAGGRLASGFLTGKSAIDVAMHTRYGMIHGRFQPFHLGHFHYALTAAQRCAHLIVGITNPDPSCIVAEATDPERHRPEANIFTFFERQQMIRAALTEAGLDEQRISFVPFPIHHPERWRYYCPPDALHFLRVFSAWGQEKMRRFQEMGWRVEVLDAGARKDMSGSEVRRRLRAGQGWEELVPPAVAEVLREIGAVERLSGQQGAGNGEQGK